jgi:striatin 1/3/4
MQLNSFLDTDGDELFASEFREESDRDKSKSFLGKCVQEVTYHVVRPTHPGSQVDDNQQDLPPNHNYPNQHSHQQSLEEVYMHQRQKQPQHEISNPTTLPNHQPPPVPSISDVTHLSRTTNHGQQASFMSRTLFDQHNLQPNPPVTVIDNRSLSASEFGSAPDDQIERFTHSYDVHGRPIAPKHDDDDSLRISEEPDNTDTGGWNFDEPPEPQAAEDHTSDLPIRQRPDNDIFPFVNLGPVKPSQRGGLGSHRRKSSSSRRRPSDGSHELRELSSSQVGGGSKSDASIFKVRFALRGHLDVVRSVIFTGGGSPSEPEICTTGDDGVIKRWILPASYGSFDAHGPNQGNDLDVPSYFSHRGHTGAVMSLAACPASQNFSNGGRALGDGWVFSGGQDTMVRVWERGRVDPKATLDGHTDAVWSICVLPGNSGSVLGDQCHRYGGPERIILVSGSADGTVLIWAVSAPPQLTSPHQGSRRGAGGSRRANSVSSGSNFPSSPQPNTASSMSFHYCLLHRIERADHPAPTCISPLSMTGHAFVVSYNDASVLIFDTRTGEEVVGMASLETYDGTPATGVNAVVATTVGLDGTLSLDSGRGLSEDEGIVHGATGSSGGVEGVVISGHEDGYIRFFDANSGKYNSVRRIRAVEVFLISHAGQCTYTMLAHPSAISSLYLSPDGREMVSAGHDASLRYWSLEKRSCTQEITSHRLMRGEGVCAVVWSQDGRWVVSGGGDGVVKVFAR